MPLCSCSVVPAALALRRQGAEQGRYGVVSRFGSRDRRGRQCWYVRAHRPFFRVLSSPGRDRQRARDRLVIRALEQSRAAGAARCRRIRRAGVARCRTSFAAIRRPEEHVEHDQTGRCAPPRRRDPPAPWWMRWLFITASLRSSTTSCPQLFLGIVLAALIGAMWLPTDISIRGRGRGTHVLSYLVMMAVGIPAYVCAAASTPIAAGLIAGGVSPGAAMVFLLAGPATNVAIWSCCARVRHAPSGGLRGHDRRHQRGAGRVSRPHGRHDVTCLRSMPMYDARFPRSTLRIVCTLVFLASILRSGSIAFSRLFPPRVGGRLARLVTRASTR